MRIHKRTNSKFLVKESGNTNLCQTPDISEIILNLQNYNIWQIFIKFAGVAWTAKRFVSIEAFLISIIQ